MLIIEAVSAPLGGRIDDLLGGSACDAKVDPTCPGHCGQQCPEKCQNYCPAVCPSEYCVGKCQPKAMVDMYEMVSYPGDKFVSEILDILETTDVREIQKELKAVIFSDEVLNLGLQHFVVSSYEKAVEGI
jgi:hypothetical protein